MAELVVALDLPDSRKALAMAKKLRGKVDWLKVGLELFCAAGPSVIRKLKDSGFKVFLDLKFHDIPNTVSGAVRSAAAAGADMLTLHAAGGAAMLEAAAAARDKSTHRPLLLGVTVLTSISKGSYLAMTGRTPAYAVGILTGLAHLHKLDGVVCSVHEVRAVRKVAPPGFVCLTPGIRPPGASADDQGRVARPAAAVSAGADFLVVGRPITTAADPALAVGTILEDMARGEGLRRRRKHG